MERDCYLGSHAYFGFLFHEVASSDMAESSASNDDPAGSVGALFVLFISPRVRGSYRILFVHQRSNLLRMLSGYSVEYNETD